MGLFVKSWVGAKIENGPGAGGGGIVPGSVFMLRWRRKGADLREFRGYPGKSRSGKGGGRLECERFAGPRLGAPVRVGC